MRRIALLSLLLSTALSAGAHADFYTLSPERELIHESAVPEPVYPLIIPHYVPRAYEPVMVEPDSHVRVLRHTRPHRIHHVARHHAPPCACTCPVPGSAAAPADVTPTTPTGALPPKPVKPTVSTPMRPAVTPPGVSMAPAPAPVNPIANQFMPNIPPVATPAAPTPSSAPAATTPVPTPMIPVPTSSVPTPLVSVPAPTVSAPTPLARPAMVPVPTPIVPTVTPAPVQPH